MITSRFHKDEAVLQRDTLIRKAKNRRLVFFSVELLVMLALFILIPIALKQMVASPFYMPLVPAIMVPLAFGAGFLATGAYFKKRLYNIADLTEKPAVRSSYARVGMVWTVVFVLLLLIFLIALPPFGGTNLAESQMAREGNPSVGANSYLRLQFQGADIFSTYRSEISVESRQNYTLDLYLMYKSDADTLTFDPAAPPTNVINATANASKYEYKGAELDSREYTLIIYNGNNDSALIHYRVFERTSDMLSTLFIAFFIVYIAIAAGWVVHVRSLARKEALPPVMPPAPIQLPAQAPMPGPPQPGARMPAQLMPPYATAPTADEGGVPMSITCPRCNTAFEVMRGAGPTKIRCPNCGKEGTLAGLPAAALAEARAQQATAPAPPMQQPAPAAGMQYAPQYQEQAPAQPQYAPQYQSQYASQNAPQYPPQYAEEQPQGRGAPAAAPPQAATLSPYEQAPPGAPAPSPYEQLMAMGIGGGETIPEAAASPVEAQPEAPAPPPAPAAAQRAPPSPAAPAYAPPAPSAGKRTIACPRCKQAFQIDKVDGPQNIRCPHCGKEGTIGAKKAPAPSTIGAVAAPPAAPPMPVQAPAPAMPALARGRPVALAGTGAQPQTPASMAAAAPAGAVAPKMISCPQCKKPFAVTETRRPVQVKCPNCGKEGVLRK